MVIFGDENIFSIEYDFVEDCNDTLGELCIYIDGYNICSYKSPNYVGNSIVNLYYIAEFFLEKTEYLIGYDPFPLPINGNNVIEILEIASNYSIDDENEFDLWHFAKSEWIFKHCLFTNRDGAILPNLFFLRKDDIMEVSYNNIFWENEKIFFDKRVGTHNLDLKMFKNTLYYFLSSIITELNNKNCLNSKLNIWKNQLEFWK